MSKQRLTQVLRRLKSEQRLTASVKTSDVVLRRLTSEQRLTQVLRRQNSVSSKVLRRLNSAVEMVLRRLSEQRLNVTSGALLTIQLYH